jgi:hypothetical protein
LCCRFDESFSGQHQVWQEVTKTFERARRYHGGLLYHKTVSLARLQNRLSLRFSFSRMFPRPADHYRR